MLSLNISKFHHPSGYRKTFNRKCFCCFMVCTCDRRIRRTAHQLIEFDGRHSKSLNLMVCPPNPGIPRSVLHIRSRSSSITISSTSINVRSKCTSRHSTFFSRLHRKETSRVVYAIVRASERHHVQNYSPKGARGTSCIGVTSAYSNQGRIERDHNRSTDHPGLKGP